MVDRYQLQNIHIPIYGKYKLSIAQTQAWNRECAIMYEDNMIGWPVHFTSCKDLAVMLEEAMKGNFFRWIQEEIKNNHEYDDEWLDELPSRLTQWLNEERN